MAGLRSSTRDDILFGLEGETKGEFMRFNCEWNGGIGILGISLLWVGKLGEFGDGFKGGTGTLFVSAFICKLELDCIFWLWAEFELNWEFELKGELGVESEAFGLVIWPFGIQLSKDECEFKEGSFE